MKNRIAVLGGGIAGLASAYSLLRSGERPVVFEASNELGGLGASFEHKGIPIEKFYHVILNSDAHLVGLIEELKLAGRLHWQRTGMGFYVKGRLYPFNTAGDLLRFGGISLPARIRTGLAALRLRRMRNPEKLDDVPAAEFLKQQFGRAAFEAIWKPLLLAKFGELYAQVPAYWFWSRMCREKGSGPEVKGQIEGGLRAIARALEEAIHNGGGEVRRMSTVTRIESDCEGVRLVASGRKEEFAAAISTLPLPLLRRISTGGLETRVPLPELAYQGVVNVAVVSRKPLQPYYWNAVLDERFPFQGVVETTRVIPAERTGGRHLVYVMNYCQPDSESYECPDEVLRARALQGLETLYPHFDRSSVEAAYVFRAPYVEPVWPIGYGKKRPAPRIPGSSVFLCTTAQAYPEVNSWNTMVGLAKGTASELTAALSRRPAAALALSKA